MEEKEMIRLGTYGFNNYGNLLVIEILYSKDSEAGLSSYPIGTSPCFVMYEEPIHWEYPDLTDVSDE